MKNFFKLKTTLGHRLNQEVDNGAFSLKFNEKLIAEIESTEEELKSILDRDSSLSIYSEQEEVEKEKQKIEKEKQEIELKNSLIEEYRIKSGKNLENVDLLTTEEIKKLIEDLDKEISNQKIELSKNLASKKVEELKDLAKLSGFPEEEWSKLTKLDLIKYLVEKI
jgi:hypothetical protein